MAAAMLVVATRAAAHNSWVVVDRQAAAQGDVVRMAFVTAHDTFPASEHAAAPERVAEWLVVAGPERRRAGELAVEGTELVARHTVAQPGSHVIAVALHPRFIELAAEEFAAYLQEERAEAALQAWRGSGAGPGRELYAKYAKTFLRAGADGAGSPAWSRPAGHALEIVPGSDPTGWRAGEEVEVTVLRRGAPAAGLHVSSGNQARGGHEYVQTERTDERGRARLRLGEPGHWFLRTHALHAAPAGTKGAEGQAVDWVSAFASITVRVAGAAAAP
jgi:hypothetical protein